MKNICFSGLRESWAVQHSAVKLGERPQNETSASLPDGSGAGATRCHQFLEASAIEVLGSGHTRLWPCRALPDTFRNPSSAQLCLHMQTRKRRDCNTPGTTKEGNEVWLFCPVCAVFGAFFLVLPVNPSAPIPVSFATAENSMLGNAAGGERWRNES